jgi:RNA polymerase sigma-70 factor (ECF subfamily)
MLLRSEEITIIFRDNYQNLCRFLESIVGRGGPQQAQDIAQESFLRLCQAELGDVSTNEIRFWLFRVARNLALNEVNKVKTRGRLWKQIIHFFQNNEPDPEELLIEGEKRRLIRELLADLPEHQRSALLLREQEGMSYRQIALILNISESKLKIDIYRARKTLRALWFERVAEQK